MARKDYIMYAHPSFRITMSGNFAPILQVLKMLGQEEYDAKVKELTVSIEKDSNLKFIGETSNGFVFIDSVEQLISVAEEQFKQKNIDARIVKIIISDDETVKKNAPICIRNGPDIDTPIPSIAYKNAEGQNLPYEYNVVTTQ